jgi:hypothetical protein
VLGSSAASADVSEVVVSWRQVWHSKVLAAQLEYCAEDGGLPARDFSAIKSGLTGEPAPGTVSEDTLLRVAFPTTDPQNDACAQLALAALVRSELLTTLHEVPEGAHPHCQWQALVMFGLYDRIPPADDLTRAELSKAIEETAGSDEYRSQVLLGTLGAFASEWPAHSIEPALRAQARQLLREAGPYKPLVHPILGRERDIETRVVFLDILSSMSAPAIVDEVIVSEVLGVDRLTSELLSAEIANQRLPSTADTVEILLQAIGASGANPDPSLVDALESEGKRILSAVQSIAPRLEREEAAIAVLRERLAESGDEGLPSPYELGIRERRLTGERWRQAELVRAGEIMIRRAGQLQAATSKE